jgi:hypothetical protein
MLLSVQDIHDQLTHKLSEPFVDGDSKTLIESIRYYLQQYNKDSTIDLRTSPDWKQRLRGEYLQLKDRRNKLHTTLVKIGAGTLEFKGNTPIELLFKQQDAMDAYIEILEMRAELEGITL